MRHRISASDLARQLGDVLGRVRYRGESFLIERHNVAIAQLGPPPVRASITLREAAERWMAAGAADLTFADDLERVGAADRAPTSPWES